MKILVTGADGFVGFRLVSRLLDLGHRVIAAVRPAGTGRRIDPRAEQVRFELGDPASITAAIL